LWFLLLLLLLLLNAVIWGTAPCGSKQLAEAPRPGGVNEVLIGAHPQLAERIAAAAVEQRLLPLPPHLQGYLSVLKQQTEGSGRFDFVLCYDDGSRLLLEVKNVVFAASPAGRRPAAEAGKAAAAQQVTPEATADGGGAHNRWKPRSCSCVLLTPRASYVTPSWHDSCPDHTVTTAQARLMLMFAFRLFIPLTCDRCSGLLHTQQLLLLCRVVRPLLLPQSQNPLVRQACSHMVSSSVALGWCLTELSSTCMS
jgi:hypothetical protein